MSEYLDHPLFKFYKAMVDEYERHVPVKGDSWRHCNIFYLTDQLNKIGKKYFANTANDNELVDMANMEAMIWLRLNDTYDEIANILDRDSQRSETE